VSWRLLQLLFALLVAGALVALVLEPRVHTAPAPPRALRRPGVPAAAPQRPPEQCASAPGFTAAAASNAASLTGAAWSAFGRPETGWEIYVPLISRELGTGCAPQSEGFARALAAWQGAHGQARGGAMDEATLSALNVTWLRRRPFVTATAHNNCPPPPPPDQLAWTRPDESYSSKPVQLAAGALLAYRVMAAAARAQVPDVAGAPRLLTIFSGYRDPAGDLLACEASGHCGSVARARCSAHRTGDALDLYLGAAAGYRPESSDDANRLYQSRSAAYRWLVANGDRFGFVPYPFEPWHWEWTGAAPRADPEPSG
jgi:hypothetical protein